MCFIGADQIPGQNIIGGADELLFARIGDQIKAIATPVGVVIAATEKIANEAAAKIKINYQSIGSTPISSLPQAISTGAFYEMEVQEPTNLVQIGDAVNAMSTCQYVTSGTISAGGQVCNGYLSISLSTEILINVLCSIFRTISTWRPKPQSPLAKMENTSR